MLETEKSVYTRKTPLYDLHQRIGGKIIDFHGWFMPVQYAGIIEEHKAVRNAAGMFDLSHMGEIEVSGSGALDYLQYLTTNDVSKLQVWQAQYNLMLYPDTGIVDDLIIYRLPDKYLLVVNASNIEKDLNWMQESVMVRNFRTNLRNRSEATALIAVQGPHAEKIMNSLVDSPLTEMKYYFCGERKIGDVDVFIARTGYTGEDGFEVFIPRRYAEQMWETIANAGKDYGLQPCGLGARDTLRLEAKMALYGNDLDAGANPYEAGLGWVVKLDKGDFCGRRVLQTVKDKGPRRKLVGFEMSDRTIARNGYKVQHNGEIVGIVTSGAPSPTLGKNIGLAYVPPALSSVGTEFEVIVREKPAKAVVVKTPFYTRPK
jgi:aminomethyltransferase